MASDILSQAPNEFATNDEEKALQFQEGEGLGVANVIHVAVANDLVAIFTVETCGNPPRFHLLTGLTRNAFPTWAKLQTIFVCLVEGQKPLIALDRRVAV